MPKKGILSFGRVECLVTSSKRSIFFWESYMFGDIIENIVFFVLVVVVVEMGGRRVGDWVRVVGGSCGILGLQRYLWPL